MSQTGLGTNVEASTREKRNLPALLEIDAVRMRRFPLETSVCIKASNPIDS